ncbi:unnamed protein product [Symbiodinium pilosum]|uniref:Uncharacterized protein n=1 Tax=Symbiodinium pilosum TaxID=2952 RepID=A0A812YEW0_SYMPI|nr:unnamed protein product [Symbiodinium pilosum]
MATATILAKNRELQRMSAELAAKVQEADRYKQELAEQKRHAAPKLRKEASRSQSFSSKREAIAAPSHKATVQEVGATLRGATHPVAEDGDETLRDHIMGAHGGGVQRGGTLASVEASRSCKDELLSWATHLEARAEEFFSTELRTAAALTQKDAEVKSCLSELGFSEDR